MLLIDLLFIAGTRLGRQSNRCKIETLQAHDMSVKMSDITQGNSPGEVAH